MFESKAAETALQFAAQVPDLLRAGRSGSLIEYTRPTRVEPVCLVDMRAAQLPYIEDVLNAGLNIFSGYYLQAVSLAINVGSVDVLKTLDKLNPNRDPLEAADRAARDRWSGEAFNHGLPFPGQDDGGILASLEARAEEMSQEADGPSSQAIASINENANLSVGKLLDVKVKSDGQEATFPVAVRLMVSTIRPDVMAHTLSLGSKDTSIKERWHGWRSGQLRFWKDLVLAQDLIDEHRKNLVEDASGYYQSQTTRRNKNFISGVLSRNPSVATASSIMVMTSDTAKDLEREGRVRLKNFKDREKIFKDTYAMMFFVIDPDWEQVTIYHRSIEEPSEISIREIQRTNKRGGGPDIMEILNAFRQAKSPTL